jgi:hypothetical protein
MQQFSGAAAKAERDKILEEEGILKKKSVTGLGSPRGPAPQTHPTPHLQDKKQVCLLLVWRLDFIV